MEKQISRRSFLKKSVIALGTAAVCDLKGISNAEQVKGSETFSSEALKEEIDPHVIVKLYPGDRNSRRFDLPKQS
jgi:hypothetical protein